MVDAQCEGVTSAHYSPGLTNTVQPITLTETWGNGKTSTMSLSVTDISTEVSAEVLTVTAR